MYTVIGAPKTRTMRVLWALEELEQTYDYVPAPPRSQQVSAHNPDGKVPVLLVDGQAVTDSVAIVQFLADRHGALTHPAGTLERARQDAMTQFCVDEIEGALWTAAKNSFVLPEDKRVPAIKDTCRYEFAVAMDRLAARLGQSEFIAGADMTVPDILLGHCAGWAVAAKFELPGGPVGAYFDRLRQRAALRCAMQRATDAA